MDRTSSMTRHVSEWDRVRRRCARSCDARSCHAHPFRAHLGRAQRLLCLCAVLLLCVQPSLAGPPFQTDDPEPVEFRHFEAYAFELSDGTTAGGTDVEVPSFEMNWGAAPNLQLHIVVPVLFNLSPRGGPVTYGVGDTELGAKYRFIKETGRRPEVGIFPFVELPSGSAPRGLGVGRTWYRLPMWIQKSWGPWTSYGGGGLVVAHAPGYNDYPFAGWLVQRDVNKKLTLGAELFGHAAEGLSATSTRASTMADLGGFYSFTEGFQLLFAGGHSIAGQAETYTYLALYWTWGRHGDKDADKDAKLGSHGGRTMLSMVNSLPRCR